MAHKKLESQGSPSGWKRLLFRAPIPLYRARLGFLLGSRFLMLEHTGRKSGETRRTVLEVVVRDDDAVYIAAGWGESAQWLRNVRADPTVTFYLGTSRHQATAQEIDRADAGRLMARYAREHPKALDKLSHFMLDDPGSEPEEQAAAIAREIPMIRLPIAA